MRLDFSPALLDSVVLRCSGSGTVVWSHSHLFKYLLYVVQAKPAVPQILGLSEGAQLMGCDRMLLVRVLFGELVLHRLGRKPRRPPAEVRVAYVSSRARYFLCKIEDLAPSRVTRTESRYLPEPTTTLCLLERRGPASLLTVTRALT